MNHAHLRKTPDLEPSIKQNFKKKLFRNPIGLEAGELRIEN